MQITVKEIISIDNKTVVKFQCKVGSGTAVWKGKVAPINGQEYSVEFDINFPLEKVTKGSDESNQEYRIIQNGSFVELYGKVEAIDDDGMSYFRLSEDCLIMIDSNSPEGLLGQHICLEVDHLELEITSQ